jgi:hypothetical protein
MAGLGPYLKRIPNRTVIYFQRAVPRALQEKLGKKSWQWKAGETFIQARRNVQELLAKTDEEIALATGTVNEALLKQIDSIPLYGFRQGLEELQLQPHDIYPRHSLEDAHKLVQRQELREQGLPYADRTWDDLLTLCIRLKDPAPSTKAGSKIRI